MRNEFVNTLMGLAEADKDLILLTGDLGFGVLTKFMEKYPRQFINVGVAEQNMSGLAAGLAKSGKKVFTYSIGIFNTMRCLEQIRNDICYHDADVNIVSIGGGFAYGSLGVSHHATEDLAVMRALPNMQVVAPGDRVEAGLAARAVYEHPGPCYLRLGRGGDPVLHDKKPSFKIGKAIPMFENGDIALLSTGGILGNVMAAADILASRGIGVSVYSVHTLKPFDCDLIMDLAHRSRLVVTVEEHTISGGLGGCAAEVMAEMIGVRPPLVRIGLREGFTHEVGDTEYLRALNGLSPELIAERVQKAAGRLMKEKRVVA